MEYRINKQDLIELLSVWNRFLKKRVHLIACGGTALTLQDIKSSTKDVDFLIPKEDEFKYLITIIQQLGYVQKAGSAWQKPGEMYIFDLYPGKRIHKTELIESVLKKGNHLWIKTFQYLRIGVLNHYDLIISKLFRGVGVDFQDCAALFMAKGSEIKINILEQRYKETAKYDISEERILGNWQEFKGFLKKEGLL